VAHGPAQESAGLFYILIILDFARRLRQAVNELREVSLDPRKRAEVLLDMRKHAQVSLDLRKHAEVFLDLRKRAEILVQPELRGAGGSHDQSP
jgi:hypothetical protein